MKSLIFISLICLNSLALHAQSVAINNDGTLPNASSMLDVKSTSKGLLIPRMTSAERTGIASPAVGLLVYDSQTQSFWFYKTQGWTELVTGSGSSNFWTTDGSNIYNNNTANVGIGTTVPTTKLTIKTPINTAGWMHVGGADSIIVSEGIGGISAALGTTTNHAFRLNTNGVGRLHIYPAGEVVVGSNTTGSFGKFTVETTNNSFGISHRSVEGNILATNIGGTSAGIGTFSNTNMRIFCNSASRIFIAAATGNVGIGTDNPTYKLSVLGNIRSTEVVVETGWADYVFDKEYKLNTLDEVEKFIAINKHLPNIPSAKEITDNGLSLGDTQKRMMEKIEELTLYLIEANKKMNEAVSEINLLKTKVAVLEAPAVVH
jgi:hypothetical protein